MGVKIRGIPGLSAITAYSNDTLLYIAQLVANIHHQFIVGEFNRHAFIGTRHINFCAQLKCFAMVICIITKGATVCIMLLRFACRMVSGYIYSALVFA